MTGLVASGCLWLLASAAACGQWRAEAGWDATAMRQRTIEEALEAHTGRLMAIPGVVGTAQGLCEGKPCIKVLVARKTPQLLKRIPATVDGYTVAVEETGEFRPFDR